MRVNNGYQVQVPHFNVTWWEAPARSASSKGLVLQRSRATAWSGQGMAGGSTSRMEAICYKPIKKTYCMIYYKMYTMYIICANFFYSLLLNFVHSFIHQFIHSFIHSFTHSLAHSSVGSFIHSFIHSFTHSLAHSSVGSFVHSFIHSCIHSFTYSCM